VPLLFPGTEMPKIFLAVVLIAVMTADAMAQSNPPGGMPSAPTFSNSFGGAPGGLIRGKDQAPKVDLQGVDCERVVSRCDDMKQKYKECLNETPAACTAIMNDTTKECSSLYFACQRAQARATHRPPEDVAKNNKEREQQPDR